MKLKYYLRGAGIGIVATTLVFSIANAVSSANKRLVTGTEQTSTESCIYPERYTGRNHKTGRRDYKRTDNCCTGRNHYTGRNDNRSGNNGSHRSIRTGNTRPAADPGSTLSAGR